MIRKLLVLLCLIVLSAMVSAGPIWVIQDAVTFTENSDVPAITGELRTCSNISVQYTGTRSLSSLSIIGDSLVLYTVAGTGGLGVQFSSRDTVFDHAGVYRAFNDKMGGALPSSLGAFRILPQVQTVPAYPIAGYPIADDSLTVNLVLGQISIGCPPMYASLATLKDSSISLSWTELEPNPLAGICFNPGQVPYGPSFTLGGLKAGNYSIYIEDSVLVASITVSNVLILSGSVTEMRNPRIMCFANCDIPVKGAEVTAVKAATCDFGGPIAMAAALPETLRAITDSLGRYTLHLPANGLDFEVTVNAKGYLTQTVFAGSGYPMTASFPPSQVRSFELIPEGDKDTITVVAVVTNRGVPVESVYVSLTGGKEPLICPLMDRVLAKSSYAGSYTGKNGQVVMTGLSLSPYIDYLWSAYKFGSLSTLSQNGEIRLNSFIDPDTLRIEFNPTAVENEKPVTLLPQLVVSPNPFNPATVISFANPAGSARVSIFDIKGDKVADFRNISGNSVKWDAKNLSNGIYVVRAVVAGRVHSTKILLQK